MSAEFSLGQWPVVAVKNYLGHSIGAAGADQLISTLGVWDEGILPGITSISGPADDVRCEHLAINSQHTAVDPASMDAAIINSKGFGGNNASATVVAPHVVERILANKHRGKAWSQYCSRRQATQQVARGYDSAMSRGEVKPLYRFDHDVLSGESLQFDSREISIPGRAVAVSLDLSSPYKEWMF